MGLRKLKPVTPGTRFRSVSDFSELTPGRQKPERSLLAPWKERGGRNHDGKMTMRYRGGGHKRRYRIIDFKRDKHDIPGKVYAIQYDPNRSARIALIHYADGEKRYILAPDKLVVGQTIIAGPKAEPNIGNNLMLKDIPLGAIIHNVELYPGKGGAIARSAGTYAQLSGKEDKFAVLKLPSGEIRRVPINCHATIGSVGNAEHMNILIGKAGRNRWKGIRPRTRGVAMNPVDHPMGGGEGRASGGHPRSRKGIPAKGYKTRRKKKQSNKYIISRRKVK
jgi:large subunit ribosomal protein L2